MPKVRTPEPANRIVVSVPCGKVLLNNSIEGFEQVIFTGELAKCTYLIRGDFRNESLDL